ncbi:MAG: PP2C family protein-serine/threonine phosphatase [Planctomycetota bacterium]
MAGQTLLVLVDSDRPLDEVADRVRRAVREAIAVGAASEDGLSSATVEVRSAERPIRGIDGVRSAWVWVAGAGEDADARLAELDELHVPTLMTGGDAAAVVGGTAVWLPGDAEPTAVAATLRAQWVQAGLVNALQAEIKLLRLHQTGMADQIGKIDEELRLAAQLQKEFLPEAVPAVDDVSFGVLWRPAGYVSGDIYDVERLDEEHVGLFLADAVGHGVPAALMTMYIKRSLRTKEVDPSTDAGYRLLEPGEAMARLNNDMVERQSGKVRFATAAYAVFNVRTRVLRVARAGHPFPMWLKADGTTQMLEPDGGLLGVFPDDDYETAEITLGLGDRLLIYSDGFEMAFPDEKTGTGAAEGKRAIANDRYTHEFEGLRIGDPVAALRRLETRLEGQAGSLNQQDDLTVVCMGVGVEVGQASMPSTTANAA